MPSKTMSERQIEANRLNSKRSTGPNTEEGKAASSRNSWKHGLTSCRVILSREDQEEHDRLRDAHFARFRPVDEFEAGLVERLVSAAWRRERFQLIEDGAIEKASHRPALLHNYPGADPFAYIAEGARLLCENSSILELTHRKIASAAREYSRLLRDLMHVQANRPPLAPAAPTPAPVEEAAPELTAPVEEFTTPETPVDIPKLRTVYDFESEPECCGNQKLQNEAIPISGHSLGFPEKAAA